MQPHTTAETTQHDMRGIRPRINPSGVTRWVVGVRVGRQRVALTCDTLEEAIVNRDILRQRQAEADRLRRRRKAQGMDKREVIYFIQAGDAGPIKVGRARHDVVAKRLANLQIAAHEELRLLGTIEGDSQTERDLHRRFADGRIRGEWFESSAELLDVLVQRPKWLGLRSRIPVPVQPAGCAKSGDLQGLQIAD